MMHGVFLQSHDLMLEQANNLRGKIMTISYIGDWL